MWHIGQGIGLKIKRSRALFPQLVMYRNVVQASFMMTLPVPLQRLPSDHTLGLHGSSCLHICMACGPRGDEIAQVTCVLYQGTLLDG